MTLPAAAIVVSYLVYRSGHVVSPIATLVAAVAAGLAIYTVFINIGVGHVSERVDTIAFAAIVIGAFGWLLRAAWPELLPIGGGPDLAHHLVLIDYIERHWHLSRDVVSDPYLGEMIYYTPGSHLLVALVGAWTRTDGLHVMYPGIAFAVALKLGLVFLIARSALRDERAAIASVLLLFLTPTYLLGSFVHYSFLAQVVAELFAIATWWSIVVWDAQPSLAAMGLCAIAGMATFVTWPVWIGPPLIALAVIVALHRELTWRARLIHAALGALPVAAIIAIHLAGRLRWLAYSGTSGDAPWPTPSTIGWLFAALAAIGLVRTMVRGTRTAAPHVVFLAAIALQAIALAVVARRGGATTPYLALKMMYLAVYPLAIAASLVVPHRRWIWPVIAVAVVFIAVQRPRGPRLVHESTYRAGVWARTNLPPACIDYLVADGDTGGWLHLAVLRNPRTTARMEDPDTFEPKKAIERWIYPGGLPYAIAENFDALPRDIRTGVDVLARFGPAAVVKRRGPPRCDTGER